MCISTVDVFSCNPSPSPPPPSHCEHTISSPPSFPPFPIPISTAHFGLMGLHIHNLTWHLHKQKHPVFHHRGGHCDESIINTDFSSHWQRDLFITLFTTPFHHTYKEIFFTLHYIFTNSSDYSTRRQQGLRNVCTLMQYAQYWPLSPCLLCLAMETLCPLYTPGLRKKEKTLVEKKMGWYSTVEPLMTDHPDKRPLLWKTILRRAHPHERPWLESTLMKDHPDERPSWWKTILMRDHPNERPPWWKTILVKDHPDERPP